MFPLKLLSDLPVVIETSSAGYIGAGCLESYVPHGVLPLLGVVKRSQLRKIVRMILCVNEERNRFEGNLV